MQFTAIVKGLAPGITWQVNGIKGGSSTYGRINGKGLYFAPAAVPVSAVTVTALGSDHMTSGSAAVTVMATDPLGTVNSYSTIACGSTKLAGTCYQVNISCPGVPDENGYLLVSTPSGTRKGSVMFLTGGGGIYLYETAFKYGTTTLNTVLDAGYDVVQVTWEVPFTTGVPDGWLTGSPTGGGARKAACRQATLAKWVHDNLADGTKPFCATGNSAGGQALAYAISFYGLDSIFRMIEPTSGPPFSRLDWGCESNQPNAYSACPNVTVGYGISLSNAQSYIDPSYGDTRCSSAITSHSTANGPQFLSDSLVTTGAKTSFPNTTIHVLYGGQDKSTSYNQSQTWIQNASSTITTACISDAPHNLPDALDAAQQIATDIINDCQ